MEPKDDFLPPPQFPKPPKMDAKEEQRFQRETELQSRIEALKSLDDIHAFVEDLLQKKQILSPELKSLLQKQFEKFRLIGRQNLMIETRHKLNLLINARKDGTDPTDNPEKDNDVLTHEERLEDLRERLLSKAFTGGLLVLHPGIARNEARLDPGHAQKTVSELINDLRTGKKLFGNIIALVEGREIPSVRGLLNASITATNAHTFFIEKVNGESPRARALAFLSQVLKHHETLLTKELGPLTKVSVPDALAFLGQFALPAYELARFMRDKTDVTHIKPKELFDVLVRTQESLESPLAEDAALIKALAKANPALKGKEALFINFCMHYCTKMRIGDKLLERTDLAQHADKELFNPETNNHEAMMNNLDLFAEALNTIQIQLTAGELHIFLMLFGHEFTYAARGEPKRSIRSDISQVLNDIPVADALRLYAYAARIREKNKGKLPEDLTKASVSDALLLQWKIAQRIAEKNNDTLDSRGDKMAGFAMLDGLLGTQTITGATVLNIPQEMNEILSQYKKIFARRKEWMDFFDETQKDIEDFLKEHIDYIIPTAGILSELIGETMNWLMFRPIPARMRQLREAMERWKENEWIRANSERMEQYTENLAANEKFIEDVAKKLKIEKEFLVAMLKNDNFMQRAVIAPLNDYEKSRFLSRTSVWFNVFTRGAQRRLVHANTNLRVTVKHLQAMTMLHGRPLFDTSMPMDQLLNAWAEGRYRRDGSSIQDKNGNYVAAVKDEHFKPHSRIYPILSRR